MRKFILLLLLLFPVWTSAQASFVPGQLIVQLDSRISVAPYSQLSQLIQDSLFAHQEVLVARFGIHLFSCTPGNEDAVLKQLHRQRQVIHAQRNHRLSLRERIPNDPYFFQQWALKNTGQNGGVPGADIGAARAWEFETGGPNSRGDEIVIAVIDEGFQLNHPDLEDVFFVNQGEIAGNGIDDDQNGFIDDRNGWNAYQNNGNIPSSSHGTHVCGIIAARGDNGIGISGIGWKLKILPVAGSSESEARVIAAYGYVAEQRILYDLSKGKRGAFVVASNASFGVNQGKPENFPIWCAMYDSLGKYGILNVAATTNSNLNVDVYGDIPTACPSLYLLGVTNSTQTDEKNASAGFGTQHIDIAAPGTGIYSASGGSTYSYRTGTSMASPHVAGAIGLMYSMACDSITESFRTNPAQVALKMREIILDGAEVPGTLNEWVSGGRRLDLEKPARQLFYMNCEPIAKPRAAFTSTANRICPGDSVQFFSHSSPESRLILWSFPGGSPAGSAEPNPRVEYAQPGIYPVILTVQKGAHSDTLLVADWIRVDSCTSAVSRAPRAAFRMATSYICSGSVLQLVNTSENASQFSWSAEGIEDTSVLHPRIQVTQSGEIPVRLIAGAGIQRDTLDTLITVHVVPQRENPIISTLGNKLYTLAQGPLQWYFNEKAIPGQIGNMFSPQISGKYSVKVNNIWGCSAQSAPWPYDATVGLETILVQNAFKVWPVPAREILNIGSTNSRQFRVRIVDVLGKSCKGLSQRFMNEASIDISDLSDGFYFLQILQEDSNSSEILRFVKSTE